VGLDPFHIASSAPDAGLIKIRKPLPSPSGPMVSQRVFRVIANRHLIMFIAGFPLRSNAQHREHQKEYQQCETKHARREFVKEHATRWCQLPRLPYFDLCRMIVIDPMHNLFLGGTSSSPVLTWYLIRITKVW
jgi:hypothetical protein